MLNIRTVGYSNDVINFDTHIFNILQLNIVEYHYKSNILGEIEVLKYILNRFILVALLNHKGSRLNSGSN